MSGRRIAFFIMMYCMIILAMLSVYFFVQKEYGADPQRPYQRRFFIRFSMPEQGDPRFSGTDSDRFDTAMIRMNPFTDPMESHVIPASRSYR